jgi:hypothetical protein
MATQTAARTTVQKPHGWLDTGIVRTRFGDFEFKGGYPTPGTAASLVDAHIFSRAIDVFLAQMPAVSWFNVWKSIASAGPGTANQLVIWESLMDAHTLLLTGNSETVYALAALDLRRDGPVIVEVPAMMLGGFSDLWQNSIADIGPSGIDKGEGARFLLTPPGYKRSIPQGYIAITSPTYHVTLGVRGFLKDGRPTQAVSLMRTIRIYPLSHSADVPAMTYVNASGREIDTIFCDSELFFDDLAQLVESEAPDVLLSHERFALATIGIERGVPFLPDPARRRLLAEAARVASAHARRIAFDSRDPARKVYRDRQWEWAFVGGSATWDAEGYVNTDRRAAFSYIAVGMSPAMVEKVVGQGSQYLWTSRDASGAHLDGAKTYEMRLPPDIPARNFWSVVAYDARSRSMVRNEQKFPTVSQYTNPEVNPDGSIDIQFGPRPPKVRTRNWIQTLENAGWFPLLRFYGPLEPFFDGSWKPGDITEIRDK